MSERTWGVYGDDYVPLVELNDHDTWTELKDCVLLLAKPEEANKAQQRGRRPHRSVPERRQFAIIRELAAAEQNEMQADPGEEPF